MLGGSGFILNRIELTVKLTKGDGSSDDSGRVDALSMSAIALMQAFGYLGVSPVWLCGFVVLLVSLCWFAKFRLPVFIRSIMVVFGAAWFFLYYGSNLTVEMAASFLFLSASFKLTEIRSKRDCLVYVYIMLYLSAVSLLFNQQLGHVLLQIVTLTLCLNVLLALNGGSLRAFGSQWRSLAKLLVFALPLVIVLFIFFPRLSPLWSIPIKAQQGVTGISDSMSPGDIAELSNSAERAFRVNFSSVVPVQSSLYWRGIVLDQFDGKTWRRNTSNGGEARRGRYQLGEVYDTMSDYYQVMLEPTNQSWVFALNASKPLSNNLAKLDMGVFELSNEAIQPTRYRFSYEEAAEVLVGIPTARLLDNVERLKGSALIDLQTPEAANNRTRQWVLARQVEVDSDLALVNVLMRIFSTQQFVYTLSPPTLGDDYVDEFIFDTQRGFCAHYAGSLAYMLRVAGIPARVIVGYQGGEYYQEGGYLIVRQYDAHAWVEADIEGLGWTRLDPTAMVAPNRIELNLKEALQNGDAFLAGDPFGAATNSIEMLKWLALKADEVNYQWQKWVVNYSQNDQYSLLSRWLGEYSLSRIVVIFVAVFLAVSLGFVWLYWLTVGAPKLNAAQRSYLRWLSVLAYFGYHRDIGETPRRFLARVQQGKHERLAEKTSLKTEILERTEYE